MRFGIRLIYFIFSCLLAVSLEAQEQTIRFGSPFDFPLKLSASSSYSFTHSLKYRRSLCAYRCAVRGILDIHACEDASVLGSHGCTHLEIRIGTVAVLKIIIQEL